MRKIYGLGGVGDHHPRNTSAVHEEVHGGGPLREESHIEAWFYLGTMLVFTFWTVGDIWCRQCQEAGIGV